jgi:hypothetical protein
MKTEPQFGARSGLRSRPQTTPKALSLKSEGAFFCSLEKLYICTKIAGKKLQYIFFYF